MINMTEGKFFTPGKTIYALCRGDKLEIVSRHTAILFLIQLDILEVVQYKTICEGNAKQNFLNETESTRQEVYSDYEHTICVMLIVPEHVSFSGLYNTFILPVIRCLKITYLYCQRNGI